MAFSIWRCILQRGRNSLYHGNLQHSDGMCHGSTWRTFCMSIVRSPFKAERMQRPRGVLWRSRKIISNEALVVIRRLVRHEQDETQVARVVSRDLSRLLKVDMMAVFQEFIRQRRTLLARLVFEVMKKEPWYKPQLFVYKDILSIFAKRHLAAETEELFEELKSSGLEPELNCYTELLRAYVYTSQVEKVHKTVQEMKDTGCLPDLQVYRLLCLGLYSVGEIEAGRRYKVELYRAQHENPEPPLLEAPNPDSNDGLNGEKVGLNEEDAEADHRFEQLTDEEEEQQAMDSDGDEET